MATKADTPPPKLTIDEFITAYADRPGRYELVDGEPRMMAGAKRRHGRIMRNLVWRLSDRLQGGPCEVFGSDMGLEIDDDNYRLPDVAIYCDPRDLGPTEDDLTRLRFPKVVIEVASRPTLAVDYDTKMMEYMDLDSVGTIVFIHPKRLRLTTVERVEGNEWRTVLHLPGQPLILRDPAVTVTAEEIFAGVG